mgnify:CR=1 FL=1
MPNDEETKRRAKPNECRLANATKITSSLLSEEVPRQIERDGDGAPRESRALAAAAPSPNSWHARLRPRDRVARPLKGQPSPLAPSPLLLLLREHRLSDASVTRRPLEEARTALPHNNLFEEGLRSATARLLTSYNSLLNPSCTLSTLFQLQLPKKNPLSGKGCVK